MGQKLTSLGDIALKLNINKSQLSYYFTLGLLQSVGVAGKMHLFDELDTTYRIKLIMDLKKKKKTLQEIKDSIYENNTGKDTIS